MQKNLDQIEVLERLITDNKDIINRNLQTYNQDQAVKLIDFENDDIQFYKENLEKVISLIPNDIPISIISIIGAFRTGKSFILNIILKFLLDNANTELNLINIDEWINQLQIIPGNNEKGFKWCNGSDSQTMGIWIWNNPIIFKHPTKGEIAFLLLDTQGLFDLNTNQQKTIMLFGISSLISSHIIYNIDKRIQEDNLQHLALFSAYGQLANEKAPDSNGLQTLYFLIRDWQNFDESNDDIDNYSKVYLNKVFNTTNYSDMNNTRNQIKNCFEKIDCSFLPHPGLQAISSKYLGFVSDLNPKFTKNVCNFLRKVFIDTPIEIKKIAEADVSARELPSILELYIEIFKNQDGFPEAQTILDSTIKIQHNLAIDKSLSLFIKNADKICHISSEFIEVEKFESLINKNKLISLNYFEKMATLGDIISRDNSKLILIEKLENSIKRYTDLNESHKPLRFLGPYMFPILSIIISLISEKMFYMCSGSLSLCHEMYLLSNFSYYLTITCMIIFTLAKYLMPLIQNN
jgi:atlastin